MFDTVISAVELLTILTGASAVRLLTWGARRNGRPTPEVMHPSRASRGSDGRLVLQPVPVPVGRRRGG
jgi:hypothetical protein